MDIMHVCVLAINTEKRGSRYSDITASLTLGEAKYQSEEGLFFRILLESQAEVLDITNQ